jgi:Zn-dependent protease
MISSIAIFSLIILIISVVIHEVSHGYAAYIQGDSTAYYQGRLTLNPIKHVDPFGSVVVPIVLYILSKGAFTFGWAKPVPFNPYNLRNQRWGELLVAIAGPISNIIIAVVFGLVIRLSGEGLASPFIQLSSLVVLVNLGLAIFNMIPIPPLDGSKVLFSILPQRFQQYRVALERFSFSLFWFLCLFPSSLRS